MRTDATLLLVGVDRNIVIVIFIVVVPGVNFYSPELSRIQAFNSPELVPLFVCSGIRQALDCMEDLLASCRARLI